MRANLMIGFWPSIDNAVACAIRFLVRDHATTDASAKNSRLLELFAKFAIFFAVPYLHEIVLSDISHVVAVTGKYISIRTDMHGGPNHVAGEMFQVGPVFIMIDNVLDWHDRIEADFGRF